MNLSLGVLIGLLAGVLFVNYLIIVAWYLCQRSRAKQKEGMVEEGMKKTRSVLRRKRRQDLNAQIEKTLFGEFDRYSTPQRASHQPRQSFSVIPPSLPVHQDPPASVGPPVAFPVRNHLSVPADISSQNSGQSNADSASVYSTASAPIERHEQLLSGQSLNIPSSSSRQSGTRLPRGMDTPPNVTRDIGLFQYQLPRSHVIHEESFFLWDSPIRPFSGQQWPTRGEEPRDADVTPNVVHSQLTTPIPRALFPSRCKRSLAPQIFCHPPSQPLPPVPSRF